jgi:hypothetical protein
MGLEHEGVRPAGKQIYSCYNVDNRPDSILQIGRPCAGCRPAVRTNSEAGQGRGTAAEMCLSTAPVDD